MSDLKEIGPGEDYPTSTSTLEGSTAELARCIASLRAQIARIRMKPLDILLDFSSVWLRVTYQCKNCVTNVDLSFSILALTLTLSSH